MPLDLFLWRYVSTRRHPLSIRAGEDQRRYLGIGPGNSTTCSITVPWETRPAQPCASPLSAVRKDIQTRSSSAESETLAPEQSSLCTMSPLPSSWLESDGEVPACRPYYRAYHLQKGSRLVGQRSSGRTTHMQASWPAPFFRTAPAMQTRLFAPWIDYT